MELDESMAGIVNHNNKEGAIFSSPPPPHTAGSGKLSKTSKKIGVAKIQQKDKENQLRMMGISS